MRRIAGIFSLHVLFLVAWPLAAQDYTGTYTIKAPAGNVVSLVLTQSLKGRIRGELSGNGTVVQIDGRLDPGGTMVGTATSNGQSGFAAATLKGDSIQFMIADFGANGQPDFSTAQAIMLYRAGTPGSAKPAPTAPANPSAPDRKPAAQQQSTPAPPPAAPAAGGDQQLSQLLLSSPWCTFSYSQTSGRTSTARYVFRPDGIVTFGTNSEGGTVNQTGGGSVSLGGGATGSVYGQSQGSGQLRWRVQQGALQLDEGKGYQAVDLQISRNSGGYPILKADGTEYSQCN